MVSAICEVHIAKNGHTEILPCGLTVWAAGQIGQDLVRNMHKQLPKQQELAEVEAKGSDAWMNQGRNGDMIPSKTRIPENCGGNVIKY